MKTLTKEIFVTIRRSLKRFVSILLIVLLGVGFFAGIKATSPDMEMTVNKYYKENNFMDINLLSTWGITKDEIDNLNELGYKTEGSYSFDAMVKSDTEEAVKVLSYNKDKKINKLVLLEGKLPENNDECVIETNQYTELHKIGDTITIEDDNLKVKKLTIVGIVKSPIYISLERGSTKLSTGRINYFIYVNENNFNIEYFTEANIVFEYDSMFNNSYDDLIDSKTKELENITNEYKEKRYKEEKQKAIDKYNKNKDKYLKEKNKVETEIKNAKHKLSKAKKEYEKGIENLNSSKTKFIKEYNKNKELIKTNISKINENITNINNNIEQINQNVDIINLKLLDTSLTEEEIIGLNITKNDLENTINNLNQNKNVLLNKRELLNTNKNNLENGYNKFITTINIKQKELNKAKTTITNTEKEIKNNEEKAKKEFKESEKKLNDALEKINNLEKPVWYVLDRQSNLGFYQFNQDIDRIANLGAIFPLVFFVVAILICLTSMTRMVEEERNQLGTLKSLGFTNLQILFKYILYALLATLLGSIIGLLIGFRLLPDVIFNMYSMMYNIGTIITDFNYFYAILGTLVAIFCTLFATIIVCIKSLKEQPSELMRPKSIKSGKRILLEKIKFIWKKLSFNRKVTMRNVFRYKKRMIMTIVGIAGCTGLIIAGFGLKDCITGMVSNQYEEIFDYELEITLKDNKKNDKIFNEINKLSEVKDSIKIHKETVELSNINTNQTIQLIVPFSDVNDFIKLRDRKTHKEYKLDDKVIINEKLSTLLNIDKNDELIISKEKDYKVKVGNITENYMYHFIYMSKDTYKSDNYNTILVKTDKMNEKEEKIFADKLNKIDGISKLNFTSSMANIFDNTMKNFEYVVIVLIVSANLLAFVVLYNLASVNISERKRELATIKVLGFYDKEVYDYIGRETTILTLISIIFGIIMGKILTTFIIKTCELDMIMFNPDISITSYIYGIIITILFTIVVNITTYFALKKIEMIESLKSIE